MHIWRKEGLEALSLSSAYGTTDKEDSPMNKKVFSPLFGESFSSMCQWENGSTEGKRDFT